jgi:tRNA (guanine10-N2)-dimethyltransferase
MKHLFLLSGDYIDLGIDEIISLFDVKDYNFFERLLVADLENKNNKEKINKLFQRLALTKSIYKFLFECKLNELIDFMKNFNWNSVYEDNFCVRIYNLNNKIQNKKSKKTRTTFRSHHGKSEPFVILSEKELAGYIWRSVNKPKVNLRNPKTLIQLFISKNKAYCGLLVYENKEDFELRKSHLRPFPHPSSLHPKVARALVNITGIEENEILLDPFCGTGGFLIEAGLMDIKAIGYDINKMMINGCIKNLRYYKIKNFKIKNKNALDITDKFDYLVTDLPYGLNSNVIINYIKGNWKIGRINKKIEAKDFIKNLESFYMKFLKNLRKKLNKKAVIVFPSYVDYKKLLKQSKFKIEKEFEQYVHRSLRRKIVKIV